MADETKTKTEKKRNRLKWDAKQAKKSAVSTGVTMAVATGGAFIGSHIGQWSLAVGTVAALAGSYLEQPWATTLGASVFAGGVIGVMNQPPEDPNAKKEPFSLKAKMDGAKASATDFGQALKHTLFLDKLFKAKEAKPLAGLGASHYDSLDRMEQNLLASAVAFNASNNGQGQPQAIPPDMDRF